MNAFLSVVCVVIYCFVGAMTTTYPDASFSDDKNLVKRIGIAAAWPAVLLVALVRGVQWLVRRLVRDTQALLPNRSAQIRKPPRHVTVEMLAADREREYTPGQWIN